MADTEFLRKNSCCCHWILPEKQLNAFQVNGVETEMNTVKIRRASNSLQTKKLIHIYKIDFKPAIFPFSGQKISAWKAQQGAGDQRLLGICNDRMFFYVKSIKITEINSPVNIEQGRNNENFYGC